jgi:hypothetical protein
LKLVRHTHSTTFYHKGPLPPDIPEAVHRLTIGKREGGEGTRLWVDSLDGLIGLVSIGAVELHPWNATVDDIERPNQLVFDLDPGDGVDWPFVTETALVLRHLLEEEGFDTWPKITGGKGIHVMVPITPDMTHDEAHRYCRGVAQRVVSTAPSALIRSTRPSRSTRCSSRAWPASCSRISRTLRGSPSSLHDAAEYVLGDVISPFKAVIGEGYTAVEDRLTNAVYVRFGLPATPAPALKRLAKRADRVAAFHEATRLAAPPNGAPETLQEGLAPRRIGEVQALFLKRFRVLSEAGPAP